MSDRITCPECDGERGQQLGGLFLACRFCGGLGWVGGANEPAERGEEPPPEPPPASQHKIWHDPYVAAQLDCRYCLGTRQLTSIDEEAGTMVTAPCVCATE